MTEDISYANVTAESHSPESQITMKKTLILAASLTLALSLHGQTVLLEDDFNSYTAGALANSSAWPSAIPGTSPALSWTTNTGGPQAIVAGSVAGRSGNLYSYQENATGQTRTYSTTTLNSAYSGTDDWVLSMDFYIESMPAGISSGTYAIATVSNGDVTSAGTVLTAVSAVRTQSDANLNVFISGGAGVFFGTPFLVEEAWYTLTITGNHLTEAVSVNITGNAYNETRAHSYANSHNQFDTLTLGDWVQNGFATGRDNHVYLDNFSLTAIPEPGTYALLFSGLIGLIALLRRRRAVR